MTFAKNIISLALAVLIASSGVPAYLAEDASRDGRVDLQDVILQVQDFTEAADSAVSFSFSFGKTLNSLSSVAGLKMHVIRSRSPTVWCIIKEGQIGQCPA